MPKLEPDDTLLGFPCFNLYLGWRRAQAYYKPLMEQGMNPQRTYVMEMLHAAPREAAR